MKPARLTALVNSSTSGSVKMHVYVSSRPTATLAHDPVLTDVCGSVVSLTKFSHVQVAKKLFRYVH